MTSESHDPPRARAALDALSPTIADIPRASLLAVGLATAMTITACGQVADSNQAGSDGGPSNETGSDSFTSDSAIDSGVGSDTGSGDEDTFFPPPDTGPPCGPLDMGGGVTQLGHSVNAHGIAIKGGFVYWPDLSQGKIFKVPVDGGCPAEIATGQNHPYSIAINDFRIVWTNTASGGAGATHDGEVMACLDDGSALRVIADKQDGPTSIIAGTSIIYWTTNPEVAENDVWQAEGPGGLIGISSDPAVSVAFNSKFVYWVGHLDTVERQPYPTGPTETLSKTEALVNEIVVDEDNAYWNRVGTSPTSGEILRLGITETGAATPVVPGINRPESLAIDDANVYWATGDGNIVEYAKLSGTTRTLATGQSGVTKITSDGTNVFWSMQAGTIRRTAR